MIVPEKPDSVEKREVNSTHFRSKGLLESSRRLILKRQIQLRREKWISLTLDRQAYVDHSRRLIYKRQTKSRRDKWTSLTFVVGIVQIILDDWSRKYRFVRGQRSEFHSLSIEENLQIIVEDESTKDRFIRCEREVNLILLQSMRSSKTLSTIDIQKTNSIGERQVNLTQFDRREFADHCRRLI